MNDPLIPQRLQVLNRAVDLTMGDRNRDYGDPYENHEMIAAIATAISGETFTPEHVVMVHMATKLARMRTSPEKRDHYVDLAAYTGILHEVRHRVALEDAAIAEAEAARAAAEKRVQFGPGVVGEAK